MINRISFITFVLYLSACAQIRNVNAPKHDTASQEVKKASIGNISETSDSVIIRSTKLKGNILEISVSYAGGCRKHEFSLVGSARISKSLPPRRAIVLTHHNMGDSCQKEVTENLFFNIEDFSYSKKSGSTIFLDLMGYEKTITYKLK